MNCGGGDEDYACGGRFSATVYGYTAVAQYEPEVVSGATYLGCYKDEDGDRVMIFQEGGDDMTAKV